MDPSLPPSSQETAMTSTGMKSLVLDFVKMTKAHTGEYLAEKVADCLKLFGIDQKVRSKCYRSAVAHTTLGIYHRLG